jgi:peptide-methionine (S)-S-oxide reductase
MVRHVVSALVISAICGGAVSGCALVTGDTGAQNGKKGAKRMLPTTVVDVPSGREVATLANGCFWCTEAVFKDLKGVEKVTSGYSGGHQPNPTYREVCNGTTGHAESLQITFDPKTISNRDLLRIFFTTHDPTSLNRQGNDVGTQYRSAIFTHSDEQKKTAGEVISEITKEKLYSGKIVTEVTPFSNFYPAEEYHQDYFARNPEAGYCRAVIAPKVAKFREKYREKLKR